jgi:hypothetical protein
MAYTSSQIVQAVPTGINSAFVAIVPTSITVGGGTATASANGQVTLTSVTTSVLLNGVFSSTYTNYKVLFFANSDGADYTLTGRLSVGGSVSSATEYRTNWVYAAGGTAYAENLAAATSFGFSFGAKKQRLISFDISQPFVATQTYLTGTLLESYAAGTSGVAAATGHMNQAATSYDGIQFLPNDEDY